MPAGPDIADEQIQKRTVRRDFMLGIGTGGDDPSILAELECHSAADIDPAARRTDPGRVIWPFADTMAKQAAGSGLTACPGILSATRADRFVADATGRNRTAGPREGGAGARCPRAGCAGATGRRGGACGSRH